MNGWEYRFADYTEAQDLGKEGWEIISFNWDRPTGHGGCLLKRPVPATIRFEPCKTTTFTGEPCPES